MLLKNNSSFFRVSFDCLRFPQVPCNVSELKFARDPLGSLGSMEEWLISLGLPMYITSLAEVEYDDMAAMPGMEERHFQFAGISDPRHMRNVFPPYQAWRKDISNLRVYQILGI